MGGGAPAKGVALPSLTRRPRPSSGAALDGRCPEGPADERLGPVQHRRHLRRVIDGRVDRDVSVLHGPLAVLPPRRVRHRLLGPRRHGLHPRAVPGLPVLLRAPLPARLGVARPLRRFQVPHWDDPDPLRRLTELPRVLGDGDVLGGRQLPHRGHKHRWSHVHALYVHCEQVR